MSKAPKTRFWTLRQDLKEGGSAREGEEGMGKDGEWRMADPPSRYAATA